MITRHSKNKKSSIQEFIKRANLKRFLNGGALFGSYPGGSNIATLNIPLGTSQDIIYPNINDGRPWDLTINQDCGSISHCSAIITD